MVAGDIRQRIYNGNGIEAAKGLGLEEIQLPFHYRIGKEICKVADKILPSSSGEPKLLANCQYDEEIYPSSAQLIACENFEQQMARVIENIRTQLKAYKDEGIGIIVPTNAHVAMVRNHLSRQEFSHLAAYHERDGDDGRRFDEDKQIFVLTMHSSKGTEFRSVHILPAEKIKNDMARREVIFTAITRAKTSLFVYYSGTVDPCVLSAFSKEDLPSTANELFDI
jgi:superfamily I DNA/RNA helicase